MLNLNQQDSQVIMFKLLNFVQKFKTVCLLNSNDTSSELLWSIGYSQSEGLRITDATPENLTILNNYLQSHKHRWVFGYLGYDLKNAIITDLKSENVNVLDFPEAHVFSPDVLISCRQRLGHKAAISFQFLNPDCTSHIIDLEKIILQPLTAEDRPQASGVQLLPKTSKAQYIENVKAIQNHIKEGDCYELNYCIEFTSAPQQSLDPYSLFYNLNNLTKAPFSAFYKFDDSYILSGSPERFIKSNGTQILSQPIKGTRKRGKSAQDDKNQGEALAQSTKDQAENIMIVDLVRNDLNKICQTGSVKVDKLFEIVPFKTVWQMISSISGELKPEVAFPDILKATFPMGSMTGAPKVKAMQLIEKYENMKRGPYSGSLGYWHENKFDLNVVIRSFFYNQKTGVLTFCVGSAIVYDSDPEAEYDEVLLKAEALFKSLEQTK